MKKVKEFAGKLIEKYGEDAMYMLLETEEGFALAINYDFCKEDEWEDFKAQAIKELKKEVEEMKKTQRFEKKVSLEDLDYLEVYEFILDNDLIPKIDGWIRVIYYNVKDEKLWASALIPPRTGLVTKNSDVPIMVLKSVNDWYLEYPYVLGEGKSKEDTYLEELQQHLIDIWDIIEVSIDSAIKRVKVEGEIKERV